MTNRSLTIVSGGQSGVEGRAIDAALEHGQPCGGWCPQGRLAEDGVIPEHYPLRELEGGGYAERTAQNVRDSDATVILYFAELSGGTAATRDCCETFGKPCLLIDATRVSVAQAAARIVELEQRLRPSRLNFAGPRASGAPDAYACAREVVGRYLALRESFA